MTLVQVLVTISGFALIGLIAWYFWFSKTAGTRAVAAANGIQQLDVVVKGGYTPDVIVVKAGKPVRLNFSRQETAACSEMVLFPDFNKSASLPTGEVVPVEFTPTQAGEYSFTCQMGMFRGRLIVEA